MAGEHAEQVVVAFWFSFDWTLADGTPAPFAVIDVAHLDHEGKITELDIVYGTHPSRGASRCSGPPVKGVATHLFSAFCWGDEACRPLSQGRGHCRGLVFVGLIEQLGSSWPLPGTVQ